MPALLDDHDLELVRLCLDNGFQALAAEWPLPTSALCGARASSGSSSL